MKPSTQVRSRIDLRRVAASRLALTLAIAVAGALLLLTALAFSGGQVSIAQSLAQIASLPDPGDFVVAAQPESVAGFDLQLSKRALPDPDGLRLVGDKVVFTIAISNVLVPATPLNYLPLRDEYDPAMLSFDSAAPPPTTVSNTQGILEWDDLVPIFGGLEPPNTSATVIVTFTALHTGVTTNTAIIQNAQFDNGGIANPPPAHAQVTINELDLGDAPDSPTNANDYPTLVASNGARHLIVPGFQLGQLIDGEPDGQPDPLALGDDNNPLTMPDDEDGVTFNSPILPGMSTTITVIASAPGRLDAWFDFNANSSWADAGDRIFTGQSLVAGPNVLTFAVPPGATTSPTFARFRFSSAGVNSYVGLAMDGEVEDYRVGIASMAVIGDRVWTDTNGNGIQDAGELGLPGVTVTLYDNAGNLVTTATSDPSGLYTFTVPGGTYSVGFTPPPGYTFAPQGQGTPSTDSDPSPLTGRTTPFAVTNGQVKNDVDAGLYLPAALGDYVWYDTNADGREDTTENGIGNVTLQLYRDANGNSRLDIGTDTPITVTLTGQDGGYLFDGLQPGVYFVDVTDNLGLLTTYSHTVIPQSMPDPTGPITLTVGPDLPRRRLRLSQAEQPRHGHVGDTVWWDNNENGVLDPGEAGIGGVTVKLVDPATGAGHQHHRHEP